jgi:putative intracellular protease/amidase/DNA-directed RNA polymerase subunit RPC12/RpoP
MKVLARMLWFWLTLGALLGAAAFAEDGKKYVCVPCGLPCDSQVFDHPGVCPTCGMKLVEQGSAEATVKPSKRVAILIFNAVEIIDYAGPYEVFGAAGFDVFTVAATKDPITTAMGMTVIPKYSFADAPQADVVVVPGGGIKATRESAPTLQWIRDETTKAEHTMSVCNGAFILASTGLLDGLSATTNSPRIDQLGVEFPKIKVVHDQRFVDNGKLITTAGLSSGIDGALHVVSRMLGRGTAQQVALGIEYNWQPDAGFARAALADRLIPQVDFDSTGDWNLVSTEGSRSNWEIVVRGTTQMSAAQLMDRISETLKSKGNWNASHAASATRSDWTFKDRDGKPWSGAVTLEPVQGEAHQFTARVKIARSA